MAKVKCTICGAYLPEGTEECPVCGVSSEMFEPAGMVKCTFCGAVFEEGVDTCPICTVGSEYFVPATDEDIASMVKPATTGDGNLVKCLIVHEVKEVAILIAEHVCGTTCGCAARSHKC